MSEISDITDSRTFLEICMGIEQLCADLYQYYSELYEDIPDASYLWKKTALEEENHRLQFEMAIRLMNEVNFEVAKDTLKQAFSIQYKLMRLTDQVKINKPELQTAVARAVVLEEKLADLHITTSLKFKDEFIQRLFRALSDNDREHLTSLQRYQTILRLPHCEMGEYIPEKER